jgi:hypothetical protein
MTARLFRRILPTMMDRHGAANANTMNNDIRRAPLCTRRLQYKTTNEQSIITVIMTVKK